jgi:hypothetical protein
MSYCARMRKTIACSERKLKNGEQDIGVAEHRVMQRCACFARDYRLRPSEYITPPAWSRFCPFFSRQPCPAAAWKISAD